MNRSSVFGNSRWIQAVWQSTAIVLIAAALGLLVNGARPDGVPWIGKWAPVEQVKSAGLPETTVISLEEAQVLFFSGAALFIDARPEVLYREGHIEGALSLPWDDYERQAEAVLRHIPKNAVVITYCDGEGCSLSHELAIALMAAGYENAHILVNGWGLWLQAGLPTAQSEGS